MDFGVKFRKGQDRVMEYEGGYMAVPSVPGAGKTFVLAHLAAKLIEEEKHKPGNILIVTYMNSAVANFKDRIYSLLKKRGLNPTQGYEVMTLHTLAMKIIKEKPDKLLMDDEIQVLDEVRQLELFRAIYDDWLSRNKDKFYSLIDNERFSHQQLHKMEDTWEKAFYQIVTGSFGYFKIHGMDPGPLKTAVDSAGDTLFLGWASQLYEEYERSLSTGGFIDFNDILINAMRLLREDSELLERYQNLYSFIFEDEAQDSNIVQQEILMMLSEDSGNLIRVGDSNQAIMSTFTISDPKLFRDFCKNPMSQLESINVASRSSKHIIDMANFLVDWTRNHHPLDECKDSLAPQYIEEVEADDPFPNPVVEHYSVATKVFNSAYKELEHIAKRCKNHVDRMPKKTIAALFPTNRIAGQFIEILEKLDVPFREMTKYPRERTYAANALGAALDFIVHPYEEGKLTELIKYILEDEDKEDLLEVENYLRNIEPERFLYPLYDQVDEGLPEKLDKIIPLLREFLELSSEMPEYLVLHIAERLEFDWNRMAIAQKIASDIRYMASINPDWSLEYLAQELKDINNSYNYFANIVYDMQGFEPKPGEVTVSTLHKAKGLEWDTVILGSIDSFNFPSRLTDKFMGECYYLKEDYQNPKVLIETEFKRLTGGGKALNAVDESKIDIISERIRLLYVGITRAKEYLLLTSKRDSSIYFKVLSNYIVHRKTQLEVGD